jgi:hypothetical protein
MRYPQYKIPIQKINDSLYQIIAEYPIDRVKDVQGLKDWLGCDVAFKSNQNGTYIFCKKIEEANIVG